MTRCLLGLLVLLYVAVAAMNYSLVQSIVGSKVAQHFENQWGGEVKIGSMSLNVLNHVRLRDVLLVDPQGDTILKANRLTCRFNEFPYSSAGLNVDRVMLRDAQFHLVSDSTGKTNLQYIIDHFPPSEKETTKPFTIRVGRVSLRNVRYYHHLYTKYDPYRFPTGVVYSQMDYSHLNGVIKNVRVRNGHITCKVEQLEANEKSGFHLKKMKGNIYVADNGISVTNLDLMTDYSHIQADVLLKYHSWESMKDFLDSVTLQVQFRPGNLCSMADAAFWAPVLYPMDELINVEGYVKGPVADLHMRDMVVRFGRGSEIVMDGYIVGLPNIDTTVINANVSHMTTNYSDLLNVKHPPQFNVKVLPVIQYMGSIDIAANFMGTIKDFYANANVNTALGNIVADVALQYNEATHDYAYLGEVASAGLNLSHLAPNEWVSQTGFELAFNGDGFNPRSMTASIEGTLYNTIFRGNRLKETLLTAQVADGEASAQVKIDDPLAQIQLEGTYQMVDNSTVHAQIDIDQIDLYRLKLWQNESDSAMLLASNIEADMGWNGNLLETLNGTLRLKNTHLLRNSQTTTIDNVVLDAQSAEGQKSLTLKSDIVNLDMKGYFAYDKLGLLVRHFCDQYLPLYYNPYKQDNTTPDYLPIADADIDFNILWNDPHHKSAIFLPTIDIAPKTTILGNYNFTEDFKLVVRSDSVKIGGLCLHDIGVDCRDVSGRFNINVLMEELFVGNNSMLENVGAQLAFTPAGASCNLRWNDYQTDATKGDLLLSLSSSLEENTLSILRGGLSIHGIPWQLMNEEEIVLADKNVCVEGLMLRSEDQSIRMATHIHKSDDDWLNLVFNHFLIDQFAFLLDPIGFGASGAIDGDFTMRSIGNNPYFDADLDIANLEINDQWLGDAQLKSHWDSQHKRINISLATDAQNESGLRAPIAARGYVELGTKDPGLNFNVQVGHLPIEIAAPFLASFSSYQNGTVDGDLTVGGTLSDPQVNGTVRIENGQVLIDANNVVYTINDSVVLQPDAIVFNRMAIKDPKQGIAYLDGTIHHKSFKDMKFDLRLQSDRLYIMNTTPQGAALYGNMYASVDGTVTGTDRNMNIAVNARTEQGSRLAIPINDKRQVRGLDASNGILFLGEETEALFGNSTEEVFKAHQHYETKTTESTDAFQFKVVVNVAVTPDLQMLLPLDISQMYADISAVGSGDLEISIGSNQELSIRGPYEFDDGDMSFTILGLLTKKFTLAEGSSIVFNGPISNAHFDLDAIYSQRVNLATLTGEVSQMGKSAQNIQVQNVIQVDGTLQSPTIGFDLRMPNADQSVQDEVFSYIDRDNERDMLTQTLSLLMLSQFYNTSTSSAQGGQTANLSGGYAVLANSLGSILSEVIQVVDVNFDYKAASELTNQQLDVDISKEWNRLYFESTLGFGSESQTLQQNNGTNFTGDVLIGYKINPRWHVYGFNRSNTNDYTRSDLPYKQGVGLKYTRDFDRWSDLFHKKQPAQGKK